MPDQQRNRSLTRFWLSLLAPGWVDLTSQAGKMIMQVIAAVAEFELDYPKRRTGS